MSLSTLRVPIEPALDPAQATELARRVYFISADILDFALVGDGEITAVDLFSERPLDGPSYTEKMRYIVDNDLAGQRIGRPKRIWTSRAARPAVGTFDELTALGMAATLGEGQVALGEPLIALMDYLDAWLTSLLRENFDVAEYRYPTLIPTSTVEACGYFSSFPQYLMLVTRLHSDVDVYREFLRRYGSGGTIDAAVLGSCDNVDYTLPPTMCFHTFGHLRGRELPPDELTVVTARGKSFRFESRYHTTLERLWDFTIRETVLMGPKDHVLSARRAFMDVVFTAMDELGLTGYCEVGNDPFFCNEDTSDRVWSQRLLELKYELRLMIGPEESVAVGSFNFHDDFFGSRFGITGAGGPVHSGCFGFGLERLLYAFLCQYGVAAENWPEHVRDGVDEISGRMR